jgi:hypothetical protein
LSLGVGHYFIEFVDYLSGVDVLDYFEPDLSHFEDCLFFLTVKTFDEILVFGGVFVFVEQFDETTEDERNAWGVAAFVVNHVELLNNGLISRLYELVFPLGYLNLLLVVQQCHYHRIDFVVFRAILRRNLF